MLAGPAAVKPRPEMQAYAKPLENKALTLGKSCWISG
jgi:hypothetical protein